MITRIRRVVRRGRVRVIQVEEDTMNPTDVVVVGAGPTGLMLACELALAGVRLFSPRVGLTAGVMLALYAPAIFFDGLLQFLRSY